MTREKDVQKAVLEFLALKKVWAWRNNTGAMQAEYKGKKRFFRFGAEGSPDVFAVLPSGKMFHIECKGDNGKLSEAQEEWQRKAVHHGHYYLVCRDVSDLFPYFGGVK
jgi:hypothetical protein